MDPIPKAMRAAVYHGVNDLRIETVPVPRIASNELLVRVEACGVCPTDIKKIQYGTVPPPRIFGHETAGVIVRIGSRVRGWSVGDRVGLHHHVPCLDCDACRHRAYAQCAQYKRTGITAGFEPAGGGFAEYVRVMPFVFPGIVRIPAGNTFLEGAMLEPVNTVLKAINRLGLLRGDDVLVVGQGPIGLMFTRLLALRGMRVHARDLIPERRRVARLFGAHRVSASPAGVRCSEGGPRSGFDAVIVTVPSDAVVTESVPQLTGGGKLLLFAHTRRGTMTPLDLSAICVDEKDVLGSYSADMTLQEEVARLVFSRKLEVRRLVTHQFLLENAAEAIALASAPTAKSLKVIIRPASVEKNERGMFKENLKKV